MPVPSHHGLPSSIISICPLPNLQRLLTVSFQVQNCHTFLANVSTVLKGFQVVSLGLFLWVIYGTVATRGARVTSQNFGVSCLLPPPFLPKSLTLAEMMSAVPSLCLHLQLLSQQCFLLVEGLRSQLLYPSEYSVIPKTYRWNLASFTSTAPQKLSSNYTSCVRHTRRHSTLLPGDSRGRLPLLINVVFLEKETRRPEDTSCWPILGLLFFWWVTTRFHSGSVTVSSSIWGRPPGEATREPQEQSFLYANVITICWFSPRAWNGNIAFTMFGKRREPENNRNIIAILTRTMIANATAVCTAQKF